LTVETTNSKTGPLSCNGSVTLFNFDFPILAETHLRVVKTDSNDVETELTLGTDYTVSVSEYPGVGSITTLSTYATGNSITLYRETPQTQTTVLGNSGPYLAEVQERGFDKLTMIVQEMLEKLARAILMPVSSTDEPPDPAAMLAALQAAIDAAQDVIDNGAVPANRTISTTSPLSGGGDLSTNRTLSLSNSGVTAGSYSNPTMTVTAKGLISSITSGSGGGSSLGWFNVLDYGAAGDGVTDDTEAVQDALAALVTAGGGVLYFPGGGKEYLVAEKIEAEDVFLAICGDGVNSTKLVFDTSAHDGGILFTDTSTSDAGNVLKTLVVAGLSITTKEVDGGNAISAIFTTEGVNAARKVFVQNVEVRGYDHGGVHTDYWLKALYIENAGFEINSLSIQGTHSASQTDSDCIAIHVKTTDNLRIPLIANATNVFAHLYYRGLKIEGHSEGYHFSNFEFAESYYAVDIVGASGHLPYGIHFNAGHLSAYINCLKTSYASGIHFSGVQMQHAAAPGGGSVLDGNIISLNNSPASVFSGCAFSGRAGYSPEATNENGIYIEGDSYGVTVTGNTFRDIKSVGIVCVTPAYNIVAAGNAYHNVTTKFYTSGERCVNLDGYRGAAVYRTSNQSIPNATLTAISWSEAPTASNSETNVSGQSIWASGNPTRLTVPAGVKKIRLRGALQWAVPGGATDLGFTFRKNGSDYAYDGRPAISGGSASGGLQLAINSPAITVTEGDYFEMMAIQSSGGNLNALYQDTASPGGGRQTWAEMEIVETDGSGA
jgi:putative cofactor-binding repeat protein